MSAEVDAIGRRLPLGGEDECYIVASGIGCGLLDLVDGEVLDGCGLDGMVGVAEFGSAELGGCWPCSENGGLRVVLVNVANCALVENDHVAVGEIVFGGEGVGRIDPDAGKEGCGAKCGDWPPEAEMTISGRYTEEEDQRIHRQQVAGEKCSTEDREGDPVGEEDYCDGFALRFGKRRW